ncbi:vinculin-like [Clavelina lepadiformis]|uniref:vinculin-like n=1 Tax=Clavelina lepadiformis TaxID=159417 RepID=UPI0040433C50
MPVFHTKTIEQILEPVAQQVSHLVILHEAGEDGASMPSLEAFIGGVKAAVTNLATVGRQQASTTKDEVLRMDTPPAIEKVEKASDHLVAASSELTNDPYSKAGREKLISGARGILQGVSDLLLVFDEAEVRRICHVCQNVRDYLKVSEVVQGMEDLVTYVKNLTPGMTNMSRMVMARSSDLTNANHADKLTTEINGLKSRLPNLISSMKAFVTTVNEGGKGKDAADANRQFYVKNISNSITEIIRLLQLVSTDQEIELDQKNLLQLHQIRDNIAKNLHSARQWLNDPNAEVGDDGDIALYKTLDDARVIANEAGPLMGQKINQKCDEIGKMAEKLRELRRQGKGNTAEARQLQQQIQHALDGLVRDVDAALKGIDALTEACNTIASKTATAKEWLADPSAKPGPGTGSEAIRDITAATRNVATILDTHPNGAQTARELRDLCDEIDEMMEKVNDYRNKGQGHLPEARQLAKQVAQKIVQLNNKVAKALPKGGTPQTLEAKLDDISKWLEDPSVNDGGQGIMAARSVIADARSLAGETKDKDLRKKLLQSASECEKLCNELDDLQRRGLGDSPRAKEVAKQLQEKFEEMKDLMKDVLAQVVADEFSDTTTVLKQLSKAALTAKNVPNREENFDQKALELNRQAHKLARLGEQAVASSSLGAEEKLEAVKAASKKMTDLTPEVINAGRIVLEHPENKMAQEHFQTLKDEWTENMNDLTEMVDNSTDVAKFIKASEDGIRRDHEKCVSSMKADKPLDVLPAAGNIARRAHRIVVAGMREAKNTDDQQYVDDLERKLNNLQATIAPVTEATKVYAQNPKSQAAQSNVEQKNENLMNAVTQVRKTVEAKVVEEKMRKMQLQKEEEAPPVPPLPSDPAAPPRPPLPEEEEFPEEDEEMNEPMLEAARELHEEAKKWESKGNDIIAAAKKMALLMAKMSRLVKNEGGKKSDLIACAKEIAKASKDVTKLAGEVADKCTDKRIRNDMKKTLDRIPTISTQLRILSTVKAASLGDSTDMTKEEEEAAEQATEMLVHNAQNLMMSVKDTVKYAEAASIRIRTDTGITMRWVRK